MRQDNETIPASRAPSAPPQRDAPIAFVDLRRQFRTIRRDVLTALRGACERADFVLGGEMERFEREFADFTGARHAVGVASGTAALRLALEAAGIGKGDEVLVPANTFIATALAVTHAGGSPVLVDVDPRTHLMDPGEAGRKLTRRTRALIPVHLFGQMADMEALRALARRRRLRIVEDACQAHGATQNGRRSGTLGDLGAFSFYPGKNLGAYGDGGAVVTDSEAFARRLRELRNIGQRAKNVHARLGHNERLDSLQAAVLRVKLRRLERWNERRRRAARLYGRLLRGLPVVPPVEAAGNGHVYHLYVIRAPRRDALGGFLGKRGIQTGIHYPTPIHMQPCYRHLGLRRGAFPNAEKAAREILSLPMFPEITRDEIRRVCEGIRDFYRTEGP